MFYINIEGKVCCTQHINDAIFTDPTFFCILQHSMLMSVAGEDAAPAVVTDMLLWPTATYCEVYKKKSAFCFIF